MYREIPSSMCSSLSGIRGHESCVRIRCAAPRCIASLHVGTIHVTASPRRPQGARVHLALACLAPQKRALPRFFALAYAWYAFAAFRGESTRRTDKRDAHSVFVFEMILAPIIRPLSRFRLRRPHRERDGGIRRYQSATMRINYATSIIEQRRLARFTDTWNYVVFMKPREPVPRRVWTSNLSETREHKFGQRSPAL